MGGKYMAILQCKKTVHTDEGKQKQAALLAFSAFPELKHVIMVDEDVDIFDISDVLWAMNTRFQGYKTIEEWTNNFVERLLDKMEIQNNVKVWDGM
jgi:4-hydroxy-3-polyprenylbenzoate decarboxylase